MDGTTTTTSGGAGDEHGAQDPTSEQPQILATALGDQCSNCGARLAGDQRYCLECGQRRGKPRYSLSDPTTSTGVMSVRSGGARRPRVSANGTLIAGIGTLLLAMGVGVIIGRSSNGSSARNPVQVVRLQGATGGTAAPTSTPTTTSTPTSKAGKSSSSSSTGSKSKAKAVVAQLQSKLPPKAKVIPKALKSKVAKVGSKCTAGEKGCSKGKFTGTFFGGG